jgi:two-component sensor histidine kinase
MITDRDGRPVDYRFLWANHNFEVMTGLTGAVGRTALELVPNLERHWIEHYARVGLGRETRTFEEGSEALGRYFEVFAAPLERMGRFVITFRDISDRRRATLALEREAERSRRLLDELNHRVMNTLALIASILRMEAREAPTPEALDRVRQRVEALAALYRRLSGASAEGSVAADRYLNDLAEQLREAMTLRTDVDLGVEADPVDLPTAVAVPLGLVVTELATNSLKYAFPEGRGGRIGISLRRHRSGLRLRVEDDGMGLDAGRRARRSGTGLGGRLVDAFVADLGGRHAVESDATGTRVTIDLPLTPA